MNTQYFAACPKGLESLLFNELQTLGMSEVRETLAGVYFSGQLADLYRACLWSRLANKILLPLATIDTKSDDSLYSGVNHIAWEEHLKVDGSFKVDFVGTNSLIRNTQYGAVRVKDAIVDRFQKTHGQRPSISKQAPDIIINARLSKDKLHISLDLSGQSLHRRGYRQKQGQAPLKENLASAILLRANAIETLTQGGYLLDPMCGSATLLIEGTMMAADIAPGLLRKSTDWGFSQWLQFDPKQWQTLIDEAQARRGKGLTTLREQDFEARGYDQDWKVIQAAEENIERAGLEAFIRVSVKPIEEFSKPTHKTMPKGLLICNPPYGERLGEEKLLEPVYQHLGKMLREEFLGWQAGVITSNLALAKHIGISARKKYKFWNGTLPAELLCFDIAPETFYKHLDKSDSVHDEQELSPGTQMVYNRLLKNKKQLSKWIKQNNIECYRLYDADIPEYAVAIDIYGDYVHVQEYAAPKNIDERKAQVRFNEALNAITMALHVDEHRLFIKQRRQNKGKQQYEKLSDGQENRALIAVKEGSATLLVNLWSYLDCGLFLDHRPVRKRIAQLAAGKQFLNLFCYTASATVQAALAGAISSVSVDMSRTYIDWARKNFEANHINLKRHSLVQEDCLVWLKQCRQGFDVIMLDPPSFSNSKRMIDVLDIQRDHADLVHRCMDLLNPGGTLIFSNNLRSFKLDKMLEQKYAIECITEKTLDPDFKRNPKIHHCWLIRYKDCL